MEVRSGLASFGGVNNEYRYRLVRTWDASKPHLVWIMLNPSTADANKDDPTIRRCIQYAKDWGYGGIEVFNIFALRSTLPVKLYRHADPEGPENLKYIREACADREVVCAWGNHGYTVKKQGAKIKQVLEEIGAVTFCLGLTMIGEPVHPLYQPKNAELFEF